MAAVVRSVVHNVMLTCTKMQLEMVCMLVDTFLPKYYYIKQCALQLSGICALCSIATPTGLGVLGKVSVDEVA